MKNQSFFDVLSKKEKKLIRFGLHHLFVINFIGIAMMSYSIVKDVTSLPQPTNYNAKKYNFVQNQIIVQKPPSAPSQTVTLLKQKLTPTPTIYIQTHQAAPVTPTSSPVRHATTTPTQVVNQEQGSSEQMYLLGLINSERSKQGASQLTLDQTLSACALSHSQAMASQNQLFHNLDGDVCDNSKTKGENVGESSASGTQGIDMVHNMMVAEKPNGHWAIMIDSRFTHVGIGIFTTSSGVWITEDFGGN